jgi:choline dehydrogenase
MESFDHIVIGAGSAGCAVAARLSEDPHRQVLLLEAGGSDRRIAARAPLAFSSMFHTPADWDHQTEPEPAAGNRTMHHPRGKILGGTSAMNASLWVRGSALDYDGWGIPWWGWADVEPVFRRMESHFLRDEAHGAGGPMKINPPRSPDPVTDAFVRSAVASGIAATDDLSGPALDGVGRSPTTVVGGRRWSTARGYLDPARRRRNFHLMTQALVRGIVIRNGRAVGVELKHRGRLEQLRASSDIVLSAGAFNTPQLLQLSGIGPAEHLRSVGVDVVADNPAVGAHLTDHPATFCNFELRPPWIGLYDAANPKYLVQWLTSGRGKLSSSAAEALAHVRTRPGLAAVDMQLILAPAFFFENGAATHPRPAYSIGQSLWTPASRGEVRIVSPDPDVPVSVRLNLLSERDDVEALIGGIRRTRGIVAASPLREMTTAEITPGPEFQRDDDLEAWVRGSEQHSSHPACSARIGRRGEGALDPQLRVHRVGNLRVADASALHSIPRANTGAPSIMVGERCADFIRGRHRAATDEAGRTDQATGFAYQAQNGAR